ncbi:TPA: hypothetical protein I9Z35_002873 [Clostridium perfringens]|nr:hypothetical protein [Clostridium perfringens]
MENLTLDFNNFGSRAALGTYEKCDSLTLTIVLDEKDYAGYKFKIVAKKSDGHIIEQDIKEQDINREEKIIKTELNNQFTTKEGVVKLEINMIKGGKEDTTKEAFFIVRDTINGEVVESTSIIPTLEGVKVFIDEAVSSLGDLEQAGEDIALINGEFKENEIKRKANELLRERSEKERVRLESIRTTEEADRIKAEAERKEAENNRKVTESNRKLAENTRKTNEAARIEAELNRQSLFEENEEIRNENENLRIEAEKERKLTFSNNNKFESERVEAEKLRAIAEDKRVTAEKARANAEEERVKAETRRENTYTDFNDSEVERRNNEANRARAEAERVNAESGRNELFNTNEEKRNSTFIESERTRERAFNEAQSNRNEAYEESERVREEAFKVSEAARNEAEKGRVAEELLRVEAEKNRKVAESKRVETESVRVETEKLRVSAETERVEAENLRVIAEDERVAAEAKREDGFNKFEGKINANTEELKNARSATTGEKFDTLDERIDNEVDRLNKKIEVSMLQQESAESHVVENTVDGMTTDMIVKGGTLNNLLVPQKANLQGGWSLQRDNIFSVTSDGNGFADIRFSNLPIKPNTNYTCYIEVLENTLTGEGNISIFGVNEFGNGVSITCKSQGIVKVKSLSSSDKNGFYLGFYKNDIKTGNLKVRIMLIEGDYTNKPINYFEGIKSFGQEEDKISILSNGKNLVDLKNVLDNEKINYTISEGAYFFTPDVKLFNNGVFKPKNANQFALSCKIKLGTCTNARFDIVYEDGTIKSSNFATSNLGFSDISVISDISKKVSYIRMNWSSVGTIYLKDLQIEEETQSTSYEPYKCDKKDILLQNLGFDEGLRGLNSTVYDELNDVSKKAIKRIEKDIITGNEDFQKAGNANYYFLIGNNHKPLSKTLNNKYPDKNCSNVEESGLWCGNAYKLCIKDLSVNTVEELKTKLKQWYVEENPLIIYYELAEPVETPFTENINAKTFGERTYVSFENAISGTSSFKAPVATTATITRLNRENRALEEENAKLKAETYKNAEDIIITNEELQITQSAVDHLLFSNLNASGTAMLYNGKKKGGGSMGAYLAMRIIKGKLKYDAVMKQYGEFKEDIDLILEAEGYGHLITQQ